MHEWNEYYTVDKEATCVEEGVRRIYCATCGIVKPGSEELIPEKGHSFTKYISDQNATCEKDGTKTAVCDRCSEKDIITIEGSATGHTEVFDEAVEVTCTTNGLTEGKHCSVCKKVLIKQEIVVAQGHTEVVDEAVKATCTKNGISEGKHCSVCKEVLVKQEIIEATGHKLFEDILKPDGTRNVVCEYCRIIWVTIPKQSEIDSVTSDVAGELIVKWKKDASADGYRLQYSTNESFTTDTTETMNITDVSTTVINLTGLESGRTYYVRIAGYVEKDDTEYCGNYSISKSVKVKSSFKVKDISSKTYSGSYIKPIVTAVDEGKVLEVNKDYTVSYKNNKNIGTATVTITGIGDYEGTVTKTFKIYAPLGKIYTVSGIKYKITNTNTNGTGTVSVTGASKKTITSLTINPTVTIGNCKYKVMSIAEKAFKGYTKLKTVSIGTNVTTINNSAFSGCSALTTVKGCTKVTKLGNYVFYNCKKLVRVGGYIGKVTLPAVKTIGSSTFQNCIALTSVNLSSKQLTSIGAGAFNGCTKLKTVKIESTNLKSIGKNCFYNCKNLSTVTIKSTKLTKNNVGSNAFKNTKVTCTFKVPKSKVSAYKTLLKAKGANSKITVKKY